MSDLKHFSTRVYLWVVAVLLSITAAILLVARCIPANAVSTIFQ